MASNDNSKFIKEQKCPGCGAPLVFNPANGKLTCEYCGGEYEIQEETPAAGSTAAEGADTGAEGDDGIHGFDFKKFQNQKIASQGENIPVYICKSCGAEVLAPAEEVALTCPYCSNNIVLTDKVSGNMRPDGIIPFKFKKDELPNRMKTFYQDKKLLPPDFFSKSELSKVTGIYVPFWLFSGRLTGTLRYRGDIITKHREGQYEVTKTDHFRLIRHADVSFADIPIDASEKIKDELMDSIEPFNMQEMKAFAPAYLAGYTADRFDEVGENLQVRATNRMMKTAMSEARAQAAKGYQGIVEEGGSLDAQDIDAKYVLLPVYLFNRTYNGKTYEFAVNGQTGKIVGEVPTDKSVASKYFFKRMGIVAAIAMVVISLISLF